MAAACEFQGIAEQQLHVSQIAGRAVALLGIVDQLDAQPQPRQVGAEVMTDRSEHPRAVFDQALRTFAHAVERADQLADFTRAALAQRRALVAGADMRDFPGEALDRPQLPAQRP